MNLSATKKITLCAMAVTLTVLVLYAASVLPYVKIACMFLSSVFVYALLCEGKYGSALLVYLASSLLGFLILPDKMYLGLYIILFGHFAVFKEFIESKITDIVIGMGIKLLYCNAFTALGYVLARALFLFEIPTDLGIPVYLVIIGLEVAFVVFDLLLTVCKKFYEARIRRIILSEK